MLQVRKLEKLTDFALSHRLTADTGPEISDFLRLGLFFTTRCLMSVTGSSTKSLMSGALSADLSCGQVK